MRSRARLLASTPGELQDKEARRGARPSLSGRRGPGSAARGGALFAVGKTLFAVGKSELGLEAGVLFAQTLVLGAQRLQALAQGGLGRALVGGNAVGERVRAVAQSFDLRAQGGLGVEPLA
jgi:hypothetical protein